jgi:hypothetical protein
MIHVPKTGGTSIWRCVDQMGIPVQNMGYSLHPVCDTSAPFTNMEHLSVQHLISKGVFTREWYDSCFKFAFVRNPWDRLVSLFEYLQYRLNQKRLRESNQYLSSFDTFVRKLTEPGCTYIHPIGKLPTDDWSQANPQSRWIEQGVDFVGRYEGLETDWKYICDKIGIPYHKLPVYGKSSKRLSHYKDYYTPELWRAVREFYIEDVQNFGYW